MNSFDKEQTKPYFENWERVALKIEKLYDEKDERAVVLMLDSIDNFEQLLVCGGRDLNTLPTESDYRLQPLNGKERLDFIKKRIKSHYAFVQLNMLYGETKKKVARLGAMEQKNQR